MYTNGLKDRFGSPLVSQRDVISMYGTKDEIDELKNLLTETKENVDEIQGVIDDVNLKYGFATKIDVIDVRNTLDENNTEVINQIADLKEDDETILSRIRTLDNGYTEYETNIFGFNVEVGSNYNLYSFNIGSRHLPKGVIKTVGVYARETTTETQYNTEGCYLIAECYDADGVLQNTNISTNKVKMVFKTTTNVLNEWHFENLCKVNGGFIKFIPSLDGMSTVDQVAFGCLVDLNHTHSDCSCVDSSGTTQNNIIPFCKFSGEFERTRETDEHVSNNDIHLRQYERDIIESFYTTEEIDLFNNNVNSETLGIATIKGFVLERPYITNGYYTGLKWNISSAGSGVVYLHVTLKDKSGAFIKHLVSKDTQDLSSTGDKIWNFDEFNINDNIGSIVVTGSTDGINNGTTSIRVRTHGGTNNSSDGSEASNNNFIVNVIFRGTKATKDNFITESDLDGIQKKFYHDVWTNYKTGDILDGASITSFQFAKEHFVTGNFDRIELPYTGRSSSSATGYLCVQFFDSSNEVISRHYSENKITQNTSGKHICQFNFAQTIQLPEDYAYIRFTLVPNHYTIPDGTNGLSFRVIPIKRNNSFTFNSGTNTNAYDSTSAKNWTIYVKVLERKIAINTGITYRDYDWSPDVNNVVSVTVPTNTNTPWVAPVNGWIVTNGTTTVTTSAAGYLVLNNKNFIYSSSSSYPQAQFIVRKGDTLTGTVAYTVQFYPCRSEEYDYRMPITTPYDIWKGAVIYDEETGNAIGTADLYVPDASAWRTEVGSTIIGEISSIADEQAVDSDGNLLFNIQSDHIVNGSQMFSGSTITSWQGNLDILEKAQGMFASSQIASWDTNLPALKVGQTMFHNSKLTSFVGDLSSLTDGWYMFNNCTNLTTVSFGTNGLAALTDGTNMFFGCSLSYASLMNVLNALPTITSSKSIDITVADDVAEEMANDEIFQGLEVPAYSSGSYGSITYNGWTIRLTSQSGFTIETDDSTPYDVSAANGYIPDASSWNTDVYNANDLTIARVIDGVAYDS